MINASFDTKTGTIALAIDVDTSIEAQILSMGALGYEFDQTPESVSIDRVQALYGQVQFDLMQYGDTGEDIWDVLITAAEIADISVTLTLTTWERDAYTFPMKLRLADIGMDERARKVTIRLIPNANLTATCRAVFDNVPTSKKVNFSRRQTDSANNNTPLSKLYVQKATGVKDWIESALNVVFDNEYENDVTPADSGLGSAFTSKIYDTVDGIGANVRSLIMLDMDSADFDPPNAGFETIAGEGLLSSVGGGLPSLGSWGVTTTYTITGASFTNQVRVGDFITVGLGLNLFTIVQSITPTTITVYTTFAAQFTNQTWAIARPVGADSTPAIKVLKDLAGVEGSVFGSGFSKNFYFNRLDRTSSKTVTLDYDMVMDFKPKPFYLSLGNSIVAQRADWTRGVAPDKFGAWPKGSLNTRIPNLRDYTSVAVGNANATKELKIELAPGYPMLNKGQAVIGGFEGDYSGNGYDASSDTALEGALTAIGIKSYFQALNKADGGISVEFKIMGALSLLPWQTFQFDTRAPEKYRDRQFRPTSIKYNFVDDTVTVKGYQIDDVQTPVYPDAYVRTGLNFKFGEALLEKTLELAVNDQVAEGLRLVASFTLAAPAGGQTTQLFIDRGTDITTVLPANYLITLVNPFDPRQQQTLTIATDMLADQTVISISSTFIDPTFPAGSYVYVTTQSVLGGLLLARDSGLLYQRNESVGVLTQAVNGTVTTLDVILFESLRSGQDFIIANPTNGQEYHITVDGSFNTLDTTITIQEQLIVAPAGSYILGSGAYKQSEMFITPGLWAARTIRTENAVSLGDLANEIGAGTTVTTLNLVNTPIGTQVLGDTVIVATTYAGEIQEFEVDGTQTINADPFALDVKSVVTSVALDAGDPVQQPSYNITGAIAIQAGRIDLEVSRIDDLEFDYAGLSLQVGDLVDDLSDLTDEVGDIGIDLGVISARAVLGVLSGNNVARFDLLTGATSGNAILTVTNNFVIRTGDSSTTINNNGITLFQKVSAPGSVETDVRRMFKWKDNSNPTYESAIVSYASTDQPGKAVDVTGFDINQYMRFTVRRDLTGAQDFSLGVAAGNNQFVNGAVAGDVVFLASNGKMIFRGNSHQTITPLTVYNGRVGINNLTDANYELKVTGNTYLDGDLDVSGFFFGDFIGGNRVYGTELVFGSAPFAELAFSGSTAVVLTVPNLTGDRTFAFINEGQTFSGTQTFSGPVIVQTDTSNANRALNRGAGDGRYGQLTQPNNWTGINTMNQRLQMGTDGSNTPIRFATQDGGSNSITIDLTVENGGAAGNKTVTIRNITGELITAGNVSQNIAGNKRFTGQLRADDYRSSDNSVGQTEVVVTSDVNLNPLTLNFKNGIFVGTS